MSLLLFRGASAGRKLLQNTWPCPGRSLRSDKKAELQPSRLFIARYIQQQSKPYGVDNAPGILKAIGKDHESPCQKLDHFSGKGVSQAADDDIMNGPASTLPAKLDVPPPRKPDESALKYYFNLGKAYLSFYKTGIKNAAYVNMKLVAPIRKRWKAKGGLEGASRTAWINRRELQLLRRWNHDVKRIPLFGLLFVVCGEFTPLVVLIFSNIVPYTCRIPKQIQIDRERLKQRRDKSFELTLRQTPQRAEIQSIEGLSWRELCHCSNLLGLHSSLWPSGSLPLPITSMLKRRLKRHILYLDVDDNAILRCGGVEKLNPVELEITLIDRGLPINLPQHEQRRTLSEWLSRRGTNSEQVALQQWLTRP